MLGQAVLEPKTNPWQLPGLQLHPSRACKNKEKKNTPAPPGVLHNEVSGWALKICAGPQAALVT